MKQYKVWLEDDPGSIRDIRGALDANGAAAEFMFRHDALDSSFTHFAVVIVQGVGGQSRHEVEGRLLPEYEAKEC